MQWLDRYRENETGVAAIEGAIVFPLLFIIGFGIVDTSLLMMQHHRLSAGLTSAGSYLSRAPNPQSLELLAKQLAVSGSLQSGAKPFFKSLSPEAISIVYNNTANPETNGSRDYRGGEVIKVVQVKASTPYKGLGLLKTISGGSLTLSAQHETRLMGVRT